MPLTASQFTYSTNLCIKTFVVSFELNVEYSAQHKALEIVTTGKNPKFQTNFFYPLQNIDWRLPFFLHIHIDSDVSCVCFFFSLACSISLSFLVVAMVLFVRLLGTQTLINICFSSHKKNKVIYFAMLNNKIICSSLQIESCSRQQ